MRTPFIACLLIFLAGCRGPDSAGLQAVNDAYRAAWLARDSAAVLRLFAADAVLLPHHGDVVSTTACSASSPYRAKPSTTTARAASVTTPHQPASAPDSSGGSSPRHSAQQI